MYLQETGCQAETWSTMQRVFMDVGFCGPITIITGEKHDPFAKVVLLGHSLHTLKSLCCFLNGRITREQLFQRCTSDTREKDVELDPPQDAVFLNLAIRLYRHELHLLYVQNDAQYQCIAFRANFEVAICTSLGKFAVYIWLGLTAELAGCQAGRQATISLHHSTIIIQWQSRSSWTSWTSDASGRWSTYCKMYLAMMHVSSRIWIEDS